MTETASGRLEATARARSYGWQALDSARDQRFTGALMVDVGEEIRLFFDLGVLYLAERSADPALPDRLVAAGVVTADELERGTVHVGDVAHLGRLFDRAPSIDRDRVVAAIDLMNDEVTESMASREVLAAEALPYRHHPSGIQRWRSEVDEPPEPATDESSHHDLDTEPVDSTPPTAQLATPTLPTAAPSLPAPSAGAALPPPPPPSVADAAPPVAPALPDPPGATPTVSTDHVPPGVDHTSPMADLIDLTPRLSEPPTDEPVEPPAVEAEPASPIRRTPRTTPIGPEAAADAVISWDDPDGSVDETLESIDADETVETTSPPVEPLIRPLELPNRGPDAERRSDPIPPATAPQPKRPATAARPEGMPNLPTGAERRARRDLAISSDWTVGLGMADGGAAGAAAEHSLETAPESVEPVEPDPAAEVGPAPDDDVDDRSGDAEHDDREPPTAPPTDPAPIDAVADEPSSELSIQIVWPSGAVDPRTADHAPAARPRPVDRPAPGGSARLAVGRAAAAADAEATETETASTEHPSTAASEAVVFEIDWSLGAMPPPIAQPEEQAAAADVLDDVMHAVRRTVAACETRVARSQENARPDQLGSLASLGGVLPPQPGHSVFDDVMTPSFAMPDAGQPAGEDRSGALKRLIGSLKRS